MGQKFVFDKWIVILGFAEFFAALLAICALPMSRGTHDLLPGALFGATLSVCLWLSKSVDALWKMLAITAASSATLPIAALVCIGLEYFSPLPIDNIGKGFGDVSNAALFVGGTVGAFLVLTTVLLLLGFVIPWTRVLFKALCWSVVGGVLGIVGWSLGPWLGKTIWSLKDNLRLTAPGDRFEYALAQGRAGIDSLLLVWQTGMGLLIGLAVNEISIGRHSEPPVLTHD
jgi:hypothetical protein